jgi:excisionase family DNA binding protein
MRDRGIAMKDKALSVRETASIMGCTLKYVYDLLYAKRLDGIKIGKTWRVSDRSVQSRLKSR